MQRVFPRPRGEMSQGTLGGLLEPKAGSSSPFSYPQKLRADRTPSSSPELRGDSADEHPSSSSSSSLPALAAPSRSSFHLSEPRYSPDPTSLPVQVSAAGGEDAILNQQQKSIIRSSFPLELSRCWRGGGELQGDVVTSILSSARRCSRAITSWSWGRGERDVKLCVSSTKKQLCKPAVPQAEDGVA